MTPFYPEGLEKGPTKLPHGENYGIIKADDVNFYGIKEVLTTQIEAKTSLFVDLERPHPTHKIVKGPQIHVGCVGPFNIKENYGKSTPRLDIYIPISELDNLIYIFRRIRGALIKRP